MCIGSIRFTCTTHLYFPVINDLSDEARITLGLCCRGAGCQVPIFYGDSSQPCNGPSCTTCNTPNSNLHFPDPADLGGTPAGFDLASWMAAQGLSREGGEGGDGTFLSGPGASRRVDGAGRERIALPGLKGPILVEGFRGAGNRNDIRMVGAYRDGGGGEVRLGEDVMKELELRREDLEVFKKRAREKAGVEEVGKTTVALDEEIEEVWEV